jgi:hypothetical protein
MKTCTKGEALETKIISSMQVRSFNIKSILGETMSFRKEEEGEEIWKLETYDSGFGGREKGISHLHLMVTLCTTWKIAFLT